MESGLVGDRRFGETTEADWGLRCTLRWKRRHDSEETALKRFFELAFGRCNLLHEAD